MIVITGASGQLGRLVIAELLKSVPASELVAAVRNPASVADLVAQGVEVRMADYNEPSTLTDAFAGADKVLLISSSEVGQRLPQHANVIDAAKRAGVGLLAYTSILRADTTPLPLGLEHKQTEQKLVESGIPHVILRNGWYSENYTASVPVALQFGAVMGCAGEGRISSAARADYAAAAAAVLLADDQAGRVYELAGDQSYSLSELASEIGAQSGQAVSYQNLPEAEYRQALVAAGLPEPIANLLAESDTGAAQGGLFDDGKQLSALIGRATTPIAESVRQVLAAG
ncbi:NAD(P)-dependent oxidoreductase [Marinobacterium zhoushanense]|uniref:NAD(P)-dependent oxidoreductase n=1 Tax=Marinobacterium zhoushanense TaxID=1679163 RepID=A0ABQ1JZY0_9GAMM|nr:SDR family oxidoreductase [Marinobacterium zhoushanense]GGB80738.1 NAD(P)-dependent oxidoreductase [Marinobacterium zhoushanense]